MSYILDALRRADAERERDPGRGIHAQPLPLPAEAPRRLPLWITAAIAAAAVVVAGSLLLRPAPRVAQPVGFVQAPPAVRPSPPPPVIVPVATSVSPPAPPTIVVAPPERPSAPPALAAAKVAPAAVQAPPVPTPAPAAAPVVAAPRAAPPVVAPAPLAAAAAAPAATPAPAAADRILALSELPGDVQRELPKLQVSGGVYSENPAQRLLIVGGQVMTEGAEAAPGVLVEQIRPRSAVLKFRGYRYSVQY